VLRKREGILKFLKCGLHHALQFSPADAEVTAMPRMKPKRRSMLI